MELRVYAGILRRWWWLIAIPLVVIGGWGLITYRRPAATYGATVRFTASLPPTVKGQGFDPTYYSWLTSEYIVGSLSDWIHTSSFAQDVSDELTRQGKTISAPAVQGALSSDYVRSQLILTVTTGSADDTAAIANAAVKVLGARNAEAFPQLGGVNAAVTALDAPSVNLNSPGLRSLVDLPIRLGLGLIVGLSLAFAAHYFDPYVRGRDDLERLGLAILAEIPRK